VPIEFECNDCPFKGDLLVLPDSGREGDGGYCPNCDAWFTPEHVRAVRDAQTAAYLERHPPTRPTVQLGL
jgi:hypothetical protein